MRETNNRTYALQPAYDAVCFNPNELVIMRLPFPVLLHPFIQTK